MLQQDTKELQLQTVSLSVTKSACRVTGDVKRKPNFNSITESVFSVYSQSCLL